MINLNRILIAAFCAIIGVAIYETPAKTPQEKAEARSAERAENTCISFLNKTAGKWKMNGPGFLSTAHPDGTATAAIYAELPNSLGMLIDASVACHVAADGSLIQVYLDGDALL